jgi:glycosyltransferase involved in cell wall biosynthesis
MVDIVCVTRDLGWEIKWIDLEQFVHKNRTKNDKEKYLAVKNLLTDIENFYPDVIFSYGLEYFTDVFEELTPTLNMRFCDILKKPGVSFLFDFGFPFSEGLTTENKAFFSKLQGPEYLFLCWDRRALNVMKQQGIKKSFYFPMGVNHSVFYEGKNLKQKSGSKKTEIAFVGGPTEERITYLEEIADLGLKIYGYGKDGWQRSRQLASCYRWPIKEREMLRQCYNNASISVNITRPHGFSSLNMRVFEAMACGSLMLTDDKSDARRLYREGQEIIVYSSKGDLKKKAQYFLKHEKERKRIAEAGRKRTIEQHTYLVRMKNALPIIVEFLKEQAVFSRIEKVAAKDPDTALSLLGDKVVKDLINHNLDNYYLEMAKLHRIRRKDVAIKANIEAALKDNPTHIQAREMKEGYLP